MRRQGEVGAEQAQSGGVLTDQDVARRTGGASSAPPPGSAKGRRRRGRHIWAASGRAHIEVRGVHKPESARAARLLERDLSRLEGVDWAAVNQTLGHVVVAFDDGTVAVDEIVEAVEEAEGAHDLADEDFPAGLPEHPADPRAVRRQVAALAFDVVGLATAPRPLLPRARAVSQQVAALVGLVEATPALRRSLERLLPGGDVGVAAVQALTQSLGQTPYGLVIDIGHRVLVLREVRARREAWRLREPEFHEAAHARMEAINVPPRPCAVPPGAAEHYAQASAAAALTAAAAALAATRDRGLTVAMTMAGNPKPAVLGVQTFGSVLGRLLAQRGAVPLNPRVLRLLDRVDTVVLDSDVVVTGGVSLDSVWAPPGRSSEDLWVLAHLLFDPQAPDAVQEGDGWVLGPLRPADLPPEVGADVRTLRGRGRSRNRLLGLRDDTGLAAVLEVSPELEPLATAVASVAKETGMLVVAGERSGAGERLGADRLVRGGNRLHAEVRVLQAEGRVVAVVSGRQHAALAAADVGIGVHRSGHRPPWGADVVTSRGLLDAWLVLQGAVEARAVTRRGLACAAYGSGAAALLALAGPRRGATARVGLAVVGASAVSGVAGALAAAGLGRRPEPVAEDVTTWHAMSGEEVLASLGSRAAGLTETEAGERRTPPPPARSEKPGLLRAAMGELGNPLTPALATGAGLSAALGSLTDAGLIGGAMGLNALLAGAQRVGADRALRGLQLATGRQHVHVRREGVEVMTDAERLVPGDVLVLRTGDAVPADCRVIEAESVEVDESSATGESLPVGKSSAPTAARAVADRSSMLYAGTAIAAGEVTAVVVATGASTEVGRSARLGGGRRRASGVERRLRSLTGKTVPLAVGAGVGLVAGGALRGRRLSDTLTTGVSLAVAAVPEGLPLVATVAQLASARRLSGRNALVQHPSTIEALGRVDVLCADKTGTLTTGRIRLHEVSNGFVARPLEALDEEARGILAAALRATPPASGTGHIAHPTDAAVIKGAHRAGVDDQLGAYGWRAHTELAFEPGRGYHAVLGTVGSRHLLVVKGSPETVLPSCTAWRRGGETVELDEAARREVVREVDRLARRGYRVLAVAERPARRSGGLVDQRVARLVLLGFVAMGDPVRPAASAAVTSLRKAGVDVVMVTGDHPSTAESIAAELGLLNGNRVVTGPELDAMDDDELARRVESVPVFARVSPSQKVRIVQALQQRGRVVAMTGDGANDAAAIRLADVGVALGAKATDAAKEAADVVVTDDRIETIIDAVLEGRAMWASVRDAVSVLVGGNLGEIVFTLGAEFLGPGSPLNARQLLLVNLLTDLVPALALAVRPPAGVDPATLATEGPEASLGAALTRDVLLRGALTAAAGGAGWQAGRITGITRRRAGTVALVSVVGSQLGQTVAAGWRDPLVVGSALASGAMLAGVVQTPGVSQFFGCRPLGPVGWTIGTTAAVASAVAAPVASRVLDTLGVGVDGPAT